MNYITSLTYIMLVALGVAAENSGDSTALRLDALEETVTY